jgi:hypothetical protein
MLFCLLPGSQGNSNPKEDENMRKDEKGINFERQRGRYKRNHTCKQPKAVKEIQRKKEGRWMEIFRHEFSIVVYRACPALEQVGPLTERILLQL